MELPFKLKNYLIYLCVCSFSLLFSQSKNQENLKSNMLWFGYFNRIELNKKFNLNSDIQFRSKGWLQSPSQLLGRTGLSYSFSKKLNATIGLAHFRFFINQKNTRGEWRPWQELGFNDVVGKLKIIHRLRSEQRYNQKVIDKRAVDDYLFNWRFRYKIYVLYPLLKNNKLFATAGNEVMINAGSLVKTGYFDQNRLSFGLDYVFGNKTTIQFQYLRIWQQQFNNVILEKIHVLRFNLVHNFKV